MIFCFYAFFKRDKSYEAERNEKAMKKNSSFKTLQERFLKSVTARMTVAQVVASVESGAELTFDFICYVVLAAWIAAMGLLDNSMVNLVASMLVSPLMVSLLVL